MTTDNTVIETRGWKFDVRDGCVYITRDDVTFYVDYDAETDDPVCHYWRDSDPEE